ncbi:MAG: hypothetical protein ACFFDF_25000 [Candidatus Odinarchaeota archaeon]
MEDSRRTGVQIPAGPPSTPEKKIMITTQPIQRDNRESYCACAVLRIISGDP